MGKEGPGALDRPRPVEAGWQRGLESWLDGALFSRMFTFGAVFMGLGLVVAMATPTRGATRSTRLRQDERKRAAAQAVANAVGDAPDIRAEGRRAEP